MTGAQLKHIRTTRGWKLREMADALVDTSHTTIMRWEDNPDAEVPSWVEERLFRDMPITLPLQDLHTLLDMARDEKISFEDVLNKALKSYIAERQPANVTPMPPPAEPAKDGTWKVVETIGPDSLDSARIADDPAPGNA